MTWVVPGPSLPTGTANNRSWKRHRGILPGQRWGCRPLCPTGAKTDLHLAGLPLPRANATPGPKGASSGKREPTVDMLPPGSGALLGSLMGVSGTAVGLDPQEADFEAEERALQQPGLSDRPLPHLAREPCSDTWKLQCPVTLGHRTELRRGSGPSAEKNQWLCWARTLESVSAWVKTTESPTGLRRVLCFRKARDLIQSLALAECGSAQPETLTGNTTRCGAHNTPAESTADGAARQSVAPGSAQPRNSGTAQLNTARSLPCLELVLPPHPGRKTHS